jgi:hypothetical protein
MGGAQGKVTAELWLRAKEVLIAVDTEEALKRAVDTKVGLSIIPLVECREYSCCLSSYWPSADVYVLTCAQDAGRIHNLLALIKQAGMGDVYVLTCTC